jgi:uncharacterized OB-fold protein
MAVKITDKESQGKDEMYCKWYVCPDCGQNNIFPDAKYCPDCGVKLEWALN